MNFKTNKQTFLLIAIILIYSIITLPVYCEEKALTEKEKEAYKKQLELTKYRFDRADELLKEGVISKLEYKELKDKYEKTKKAYNLIINKELNGYDLNFKTDSKNLLKQQNTYKKLVSLYNEGVISQKELIEAEIDYKLSYIELNKFQYNSDFSLMSNLLPNPLDIILKTPLKYISSTYGYRNHPITGTYSLHTGVDIAAPYGVPVYAYENGLVENCITGEKSGKMINISHGNGYNSVYMHLKDFAVSPNQFVSKGQVIGYVGSTGLSTGNHLHFEIRKNNLPQNINKLFEK